MRYLHMLELVAEYGLFGMLEPKSRKKYVEVLGDLRQRYFTFNVDETGLRRELRTWRERTEELAQLTWEGYTWRDAWSDFCNRLQGLKFRLYESLKDTEEGQAQKQTAEMEMAEQAKAADEMLTARNAVDETVMETREWFYDRLSVEMLQKTAEVFQRTGRFPVPHLYERLSEQLHDPGILHTYIHTYLTVPKGSEANRLEAAAGLFDRLLSADLKEWMPDFGGYVEMEEHIACLGKMKFFEDPDRLKQNEKFMEWYRLYLGYHARTYGLRVFGEENGKVVE